jgi:hypothetical protein
VCVCVCVFVCVCARAFVCVCVYMCVCVFAVMSYFSFKWLNSLTSPYDHSPLCMQLLSRR